MTLHTFVALGNSLPVIASPDLSGRGNLVAGLEPAIIGLGTPFEIASSLSLLAMTKGSVTDDMNERT